MSYIIEKLIQPRAALRQRTNAGLFLFYFYQAK
jgi:hypothetical protein